MIELAKKKEKRRKKEKIVQMKNTK